MKIAFLITRGDSIGGAQIHVRDMSKRLLADGYDVLVLAGRSGAYTSMLQREGVPVVVLANLGRAMHPWRDLLALMEIRRALKRYSPDLLSCHASKAGWLGRLAGRTLGLPTIFTAHGWSFTGEVKTFRHHVYQLAEKVMSGRNGKIITVCQHDRDVAVELGIADTAQLQTIHNGMPDIAEELRAMPGEHPPKLVMVARFQEPKDHALLLRALKGLSDLPWSLELVGDGPELLMIKQLTSALGMEGRVKFLGELNDVASCLAGGQIFVLVSWREGFPRSILEALRAGLPVVATRVGGIPEAVIDGINGCLCLAGDADGLRECLRPLLQSATLRVSFGKAGRRMYEERFKFERMYAETLMAYRDVLGPQAKMLDPAP